MPEVEKATRKRIATLSGYLIAVLLAAGSVGVYRLDAEAFREDVQALIRLQQLNIFLEKNPTNDLRGPMRAAARDELSRQETAINDARLAARQTFTHHLIVGLKERPPTGCKFFWERSVEGKPSAAKQKEIVQFSFMRLKNPFLDPPRDEIALTERGTVAYLLTRLEQFYAPVKATVVVGIALDPIEDPCTSFAAVEEDTNAPPELQEIVDPSVWRPPFEKVSLDVEQGNVVAIFAGIQPARQHEQQQPRRIVDDVSIKVELAEVALASAADLLSDDRYVRLIDDLRPLRGRDGVIERLDRDYGFLPINYAVSTVGASLVQGYAGASILGIKVTPKRLSLVVTAVSLLLTLAIALEGRVAVGSGIVLRDPTPEGPLGAIINVPAGRVVLWCIAPAGAVAMLDPTSTTYLAFAAAVALIGAIAVALTWACYRRT